MNDSVYQGGDFPTGANHVKVEAPNGLIDAQSVYNGQRGLLDYYMLGLPPGARDRLREELQQQKYGSSRSSASLMRSISEWIHNTNFIYRWVTGPENKKTLQGYCNHKLWTHHEDGTLNHITSRNLTPLFPEGHEELWPTLVLTSNHARAWVNQDVLELMSGTRRLLCDAGVPPDAFCRLEDTTPPQAAQGKHIIISAVHTERDPFANGANLIERRHALLQDPARHTLEYMSPAAMRLAKLIFKLMAEPASYPLIDLDRCEFEKHAELKNMPYVADHLALLDKEAANRPQHIVLRADAEAIAKHIKLIGYSKGANTVTDALRFLRAELRQAQSMVQVRGQDGTLSPLRDEDIRRVMSSLNLLSIAPGEVPLTRDEMNDGIHRTTLFNHNDLIAGHFVRPHEGEYDTANDHLIELNGTTLNAGHGPKDAMGDRGQQGFIMDKTRSEGNTAAALAYREAQNAVRSFAGTPLVEYAALGPHAAALQGRSANGRGLGG